MSDTMNGGDPGGAAPSLLPSAVMAAARGVLMAAGASLVTRGYLTGAQENELAGGAIALVALAWSLWQKRNANRALKAAIAAPAIPAAAR
ncbi:MAG: hypothetical protein ABI376_03705 [Caulobacteraceae bacterium]